MVDRSDLLRGGKLGLEVVDLGFETTNRLVFRDYPVLHVVASDFVLAQLLGQLDTFLLRSLPLIRLLFAEFDGSLKLLS